MTTITEAEFSRIVAGIYDDRDLIIRHNPIGTDSDILLWMLLSCLVSYLNLTDSEVPCFPGGTNMSIYRDAILTILSDRRIDDFDPAPYLDKLSAQ
jgi:hypothetical protein